MLWVILLQMQQVLSNAVVKASQFPARQRLLQSSVPTFEPHSIVMNSHSSGRCGVQTASTFNTIAMGHHHYWMMLLMLSLRVTIMGCSHRQQIASHLQIAAHDNESHATVDAHATTNLFKSFISTIVPDFACRQCDVCQDSSHYFTLARHQNYDGRRHIDLQI